MDNGYVLCYQGTAFEWFSTREQAEEARAKELSLYVFEPDYEYTIEEGWAELWEEW